MHFIILNPNEAFKEYSYIGLGGYTIDTVLKNGEDITNDLKMFLNYGNSYTSSTDENGNKIRISKKQRLQENFRRVYDLFPILEVNLSLLCCDAKWFQPCAQEHA